MPSGANAGGRYVYMRTVCWIRWDRRSACHSIIEHLASAVTPYERRPHALAPAWQAVVDFANRNGAGADAEDVATETILRGARSSALDECLPYLHRIAFARPPSGSPAPRSGARGERHRWRPR
jgi:hypothetical protein